MTAFVFDECFNDKRVIANCNAQGLCTARRYPKTMLGQKDPQMLPNILAGSEPLVTIDYDILDDHCSSVPATNPGVIIVKFVIIKKLMTTSDAARLLSDFKARYPNWSKRDWAGLCLEITEEGAAVSHSYNKPASARLNVLYTSNDFEAELEHAISLVLASRMLLIGQPIS